MPFKYKKTVSEAIIYMLFEKKEDEIIGFNELYKRIDLLRHPKNQIENSKPTLNPSNLSKAIKLLKSKGLVIEQKTKNNLGLWEQKQNSYSLSEIALFYIKHDYRIDEVEEFIKISQLISLIALFGSSTLEERKTVVGEKPQAGDMVVPQENPLNLDKNKGIKVKYYYGTRKEGVSKKDILERKYYLTQSNLLRLTLTKREINNYFDFLSDKKILKIYSDEDGEERYRLYDQNLEEFMNEVWVSLFGLLFLRMDKKLFYLVKKIDKVEKDWCIMHLGKKNTDYKIIDWHNKRSEIEYKKPNNKLYLEKSYKEDVKQINNLILNKFNELSVRYKNIFKSLPGMENLIISLVCSKEMIDHVREENERLIRNK
ncbi:hypothetical protein BH23THE1_BH23THE1_13400 [soil metagenome]